MRANKCGSSARALRTARSTRKSYALLLAAYLRS